MDGQTAASTTSTTSITSITSTHARIDPRRDDRLLAYTVVAAVALAIGLLSGEVEPIALSAGLLAALALGLHRAEPLELTTHVGLGTRRLIEGDPARLTVTIEHPADVRVDVRTIGASEALGAAIYSIERPEPGAAVGTSVAIEIPTPEWGRHRIGKLLVRASRPGSIAAWESALIDLGEITVVPRAARLSSLLSPRATQATAGGHAANIVIGDGSEFIDIRAYLPGDRVRDINWTATAKRRAPHVNRRRPERGGDVVIVLDATPDGWRPSDVGSALLVRAGQAVWALARNHFAAQDRVGLLTQQSDGVQWLAPRGGLRARYQLLEVLLGVNAAPDSVAKRWGIHRHDIPPAALVIGVSSLSNNVTLRSLAAMRAHGRTVGVLAIDAAKILHATDELDTASLRLASLLFEAHVAYVRRLGLPVVTWRPGEDLDRAVRRLAELTRRSVRVGIGA